MFDSMREVLQSAHGDALLRWILGVSIALGLMRKDSLCVTFCSQSTTFQKRLCVPDTSVVDVKTGMDIVNSIYDARL